MKYVKKQKNIDLVVGPSILTRDTKDKIAEAISHYKKTGEKPVSNGIMTQNSVSSTSRVEKALDQLANGQFLTSEQLNEEIEKW
jgi:hypothetical protein